MLKVRANAFTLGGLRFPPLGIRGGPGEVWPDANGKRLEWVSSGRGGRLRVLGADGLATIEARRVVGMTLGSWLDIGATDDFDVTEGAGVTLTFDLRVTFLARPGGQYIRRWAELTVLNTTASGFGG